MKGCPCSMPGQARNGYADDQFRNESTRDMCAKLLGAVLGGRGFMGHDLLV